MMIKNTGFPLSFFPEPMEKAAAGRAAEGAAGGAKGDAVNASDPSGRTGRTDRVELSARPEHPDAVLDAVTAKISGEIRGDADAGRLQELKTEVGSGSYRVDSGALAGILLFDGID